MNSRYNSQTKPLLRKCGKDEYPIQRSNNFTKPSFDNMFFTNVIRCLVIGGTGCGKTTLLQNIIEHADELHLPFTDLILYAPQMCIESDKWQNVKSFLNSHGKNLVPQPVDNYPSIKQYKEMMNNRNRAIKNNSNLRFSKEQKPKEDIDRCSQIYDSLKSIPLISPDTIYNTQQKYPNYRPLIIFDDAVSYFKNSPLLVEHYRQFMNNGTRLNVSAVFNLIQALQHLPTDLRNSCSCVIFFPNCIAPSQLSVITKNIKYNILSDSRLFKQVMELIKDRGNKFDYITISFDAPTEKQVRFNEDLFINPQL